LYELSKAKISFFHHLTSLLQISGGNQLHLAREEGVNFAVAE
jgi:hypothetical protein